MGSGTTGVACAQMGRSFTGIEIEPTYFAFACRLSRNRKKSQSNWGWRFSLYENPCANA
jgi:DNA modification methylase